VNHSVTSIHTPTVWGAGPGLGGRTALELRHSRTGSVRRLLADFFSVEAAFTWFLFAGWYKDLWELRWFPIDFTLFFFGLTFCLIAAAWFSVRVKSFSPDKAVLLLILFSMLAMASMSWSSLEAANFDKAQRFLLLTASSFCIGHMIAEDRERRQRFGRMLLRFSSVFLLYYIYCRYLLGLNMQAGDDMGPNNYLEYGSDARTLFILCLTIASLGAPRQVYAALPAAGIALYFLLIMGGRGPLVEALVALALLVLGFGWRRPRLLRRLAFCSGLIAIAATGYLIIAQPDEAGAADGDSFRTLERFQLQLNGEDTTSLDERSAGRNLAVQMWLEAPVLGFGFGEFRVRDPYLKYPHNLPLEILAELGISGTSIFFGLIAFAVQNCVRIARDRNSDWTDAAVALVFMSELVSHFTVQGYLADDRFFFALMGLIIGWRALGSRSAYSPCFPKLPTRHWKGSNARPNVGSRVTP
jgi:O-antigen ligase